MFKKRAQEIELMDDLTLANPELQKNLDEIIFWNRLFGSKYTLLTALDEIYQKYLQYFKTKKIFIADLASGGGDLLAAISTWARSLNLKVELLGIDANPFMINYAQQRYSKNDCKYKIANILDKHFLDKSFDLICLNSVCHHFNDNDLVTLFRKLKKQTHLAIIINDLRRQWLPYWAIKLITIIFNSSSLAKNDAPLSVLRAFQKNELINIFKLAQIETYSIKRSWVFRWRIIIWMKNNENSY